MGRDGSSVLIRGTIAVNSAEAISFVKNTDITSDNFQLKFKYDNGGAWRASAAGVRKPGGAMVDDFGDPDPAVKGLITEVVA